MPDLMDVIRDRRSVRKYQDKDVPEDVVGEILEAGRWAPSWANTQCWEIVVIRDPSVKQAVQRTMHEGNPGFKAIGAAPVVLALCAKLKCSGFYKGQSVSKFGAWFMFDLGIAAQNMALAAHALGVASVMLGMFDHDKAKALVNAPEDCELVALMPLGYPAEDTPAPKRREVAEFAHYDRF